ncbi:MAG: hypothetical protein HYX97_04700 [Chloroflexi bacterium]|nr:hypothetical protein [Chloroflexota bacterium]
MRNQNLLRVLVTVRAYPEPSRSVIESSCTAGITAGQEWIRLFPLNSRSLADSRKFQKYDWIEVSAVKSHDPRPESYVPDPDSMKVVGKAKGWEERRKLILPLQAQSIEELRERQARTRQSLGIIKPKRILRLAIEPSDDEWREEQEAKLAQLSLFGAKAPSPLQKIPHKFSYEFLCDDTKCERAHKMMIVDWEIHESWRKWSKTYGSGWEPKLRQRYENEMISKNATYFYVGTMFRHPSNWIVIGLFYPPAPTQTLQSALAIVDN